VESSGDRGEPRGLFGIAAEFALVTRYAIQFREENGALDGGFQLSARQSADHRWHFRSP
jgi:hypothetical protein